MELEPCYVLHHRPFTDVKSVVTFFTASRGIVKGVARKSGKKETVSAYPLFQSCLLSYHGVSDLKTIRAFEPNLPLRLLLGRAMYCGMYLNELLERILPVDEPYDKVYRDYEDTLVLLADGAMIEPALRRFEFRLIQELGYGLDCSHDALSGKLIEPSFYYAYRAELGFVQVSSDGPDNTLGSILTNISNEHFDHIETLRYAKHLSRLLFAPLLDYQPLKSRELFL